MERRALQIAASGASVNWTATAAVLNGPAWLTITPPSGTATANQASVLNADVNFGALTPGFYQGVITVRDTSTNATPTVQVRATVMAGGQARVAASPSTAVFFARAGGPAPPAQAVRIFNSGDVPLNWNIPADVQSAAPWLNVTPLAGVAAPGAASFATLTANPAGLAAGVYQAVLRVSAPTAAVDSDLVVVTLLVAPASAPPRAEAAPYGMIFVAQQGGPAPAPQSLVLSNAGGGSLTFTLQAATTVGRAVALGCAVER